jgi:NUMOD4 motif-containing protein
VEEKEPQMSWQPIKDFPGYEISPDGAVRSFVGRGRHRATKKPHNLTPVWLPSQRWAVRLNRNGERYLRCVANLVLTTFVGPAPVRGVGSMNNLADVIFKDDDSSNVCLSNLAWKTE